MRKVLSMTATARRCGMALLGLAAAAAAFPAGAVDVYKGGFPVHDQPAYQMELKLYVVTVCDERKASFIVINDGERWPATSTISIRGVARDDLRSERRLIMLMDQTVRFYVETTGGEEIALSIEPSWFNCAPRIDARVRCD
ncbi:MAG: hypothetical protein EXQ90_09185 [Rhodospirillales bacterium]|nr:hypothetical protein [Rhodospirillales bacterium]